MKPLRGRRRRRSSSWCWLLLTLASTAVMAAPADPQMVEQGRRIYEEGLLSDGRPLQAARPEGFRIEGPAAACTVCHRRSGMGSIEGNVKNTILVPPITGGLLLAPSRFAGAFLDSSHYYVPNDAWARALTRPAYDASTFARALREGLDAGGKPLIAPMMRYDLDDAAIAALLAYLSTLVAEPAPGVDKNTLHLATVVTPDASPAQTQAVLAVLNDWARNTRIVGKLWQLDVWRLQGEAATWGGQLAAAYAKQPVFALLSGVGLARWQPIETFCEQNRIPCVLPVNEAVNAADDVYYSVQYSAGVLLEARVLAKFLTQLEGGPPPARRLLQVVSDASGQQAAAMLNRSLGEQAGEENTRFFRLSSAADLWHGVTQGDSVVLWLRPAQIAQLVADYPQGPPALKVYLSALLAAPQNITLPPAWRQRVAWVSLFDDASVQGEIARVRLVQWLRQRNIAAGADLRWQADAYVASYLFKSALMEIQTQEHRRPPVALNRDHFLEVLETLVNKYGDGTTLVDPDSHVAFYGRMSLGPRQRLAVRGGSIYRYAGGEGGQLRAVSEHLVP